MENIALTEHYIDLLKSASLDNCGPSLTPEILARLRAPPEYPVDISNPDHRLSLDLFIAVTMASEAAYNTARNAILRCYPDCGILSYYQVKNLVAEITGVVSIADDMCINSCHAFTGPFEDLEACSICQEPWYDLKELARTGKKNTSSPI